MIWKDEEQDFFENIRKSVNLGLLGFEEFFSRLANVKAGTSYPHYNIEKTSSYEWCIVLAVAGFASNDLEISLDGMQLLIKGTRPEEDEKKEYIYKGIATRSFQRTFLLAEDIQISKADLENGLLKIHLNRPMNSVRSVKIPINSSVHHKNLDYTRVEGK